MVTTSPARTKKTVARSDDDTDIELVGEIDDSAESFTARVFDEEEFSFSTDINGFLLLTATRGGDEFIRLMDSLVLYDTKGTTSKKILEERRLAEQKRFHDVLARQSHLTVERLAKFVGDLMEIAGNEDGDSSSTD